MKIFEEITPPKIIGGIFFTLLTIFVTIYGNSIYQWMVEDEVIVEIKQLVVYKSNAASFPTCEFDLYIYNPNESSRLVELNQLLLSQDKIVYNFNHSDNTIFIIPGNYKGIEKIRVSSPNFDWILKIPHTAKTAGVELSYYIDEEIFKEEYTNENISKCTFCQLSIFESEEEAISYCPDYFTANVKMFCNTFDTAFSLGKIFVHPELKQFTNFEYIKKHFSKKKGLPLGGDKLYKMKYGGTYYALLKEDTNKTRIEIILPEGFSKYSDYQKYETFGFKSDLDFSKMKYFVHYYLDTLENEDDFVATQERSKYYLWVVKEGETDSSTEAIVNILKTQGYNGRKEIIEDSIQYSLFLSMMLHEKYIIWPKCDSDSLGLMQSEENWDKKIIIMGQSEYEDELFRIANGLKKRTGLASAIFRMDGILCQNNSFAPFSKNIIIFTDTFLGSKAMLKRRMFRDSEKSSNSITPKQDP